MAPHDSVAKNKGEYDSCVACYFRDKRDARTTVTEEEQEGRGEEVDSDEGQTCIRGGRMAATRPERRLVACFPKTRGRKRPRGRVSEAGDNKGLSFCA